MFKVQLIKMSDKVINDKNNNQDIKFVVLKLLEIDKKTGVPTGEMQDKYLRDGSELLNKVNFEFASYYEVDLSFSGKIIDIRELDKKEKNN
ncbi:hypothetical protein [Spiroplasma endosymbiont of Colias croceus]|uniref:hypothetical protein n=1 Tax=Spiroplasma endosymbiont of Colias croceus TaxID=3066310 RepID=UPI0030CCB69C